MLAILLSSKNKHNKIPNKYQPSINQNHSNASTFINNKKSLNKQTSGPFNKLYILLTVDQNRPEQFIVIFDFSQFLVHLNHLSQQLRAADIFSGVNLLELFCQV
jgi:hypothetical protein